MQCYIIIHTTYPMAAAAFFIYSSSTSTYSTTQFRILLSRFVVALGFGARANSLRRCVSFFSACQLLSGHFPILIIRCDCAKFHIFLILILVALRYFSFSFHTFDAFLMQNSMYYKFFIFFFLDRVSSFICFFFFLASNRGLVCFKLKCHAIFVSTV